MKVSFLFGFILVLMAFSGCNDSSNSSTLPPFKTTLGSPQEKQVETLANGVKIEIQKIAPLDIDSSNYQTFKENLNRISAKIYIPEDIAASVQIRKSVTVPGEFLVTPQFETVNENKVFRNGYYEMHLEQNLWVNNAEEKSLDLRPRTLTIKVYTKDGIVGASDATFLPDLVVSKSEVTSITKIKSLGIVSGAYAFGVIFLEANTVLETQGVSVSLQVERFYVGEQAQIVSFSEEEAAQEPDKGQIGRDGGNLEIFAKKADGRLTVYMRGTMGGKGLEAIEQTATGETGKKGIAGTTEQKCHVAGKEKNDVCFTVCASNPGNGLIGEKGPKGITGGVGMRGGSSGFAKIVVTKAMRQFDVEIISVAGEGGPGGEGGKGGPGGAGGAPGDKPKVCDQEALPGPQGPQGEMGDQGPRGDNGLRLTGVFEYNE